MGGERGCVWMCVPWANSGGEHASSQRPLHKAKKGKGGRRRCVGGGESCALTHVHPRIHRVCVGESWHTRALINERTHLDSSTRRSVHERTRQSAGTLFVVGVFEKGRV